MLRYTYDQHERYIAYAKLGVAQLFPPSGSNLCGHLNGNANGNNWTLSITCPEQSVIHTIDFASWGTPTGTVYSKIR